MVSRKGVLLHLKQGGTADYFALDLFLADQGFFVVKFSNFNKQNGETKNEQVQGF